MTDEYKAMMAKENREADAEEYESRKALAAKTHPGFVIKCEQCDGEAVGVVSDVGFSSTSGSWGAVTLDCFECGHSVDIWSAI